MKVLFCSDSTVALTASQNMTLESNVTLECNNKQNSFAKVRAAGFVWIFEHFGPQSRNGNMLHIA